MSIEDKVQSVQTTRRVQVRTLVCDGCGAEAVKAQVVLQSEVVVPKGTGVWYAAVKLDLADDSPVIDILHFCSRECLTGYLDGEPEEEPVPVMETPKKAREAVTA